MARAPEHLRPVQLNAEGAPCPTPRRHVQHGWAPSSVRCVLINPAYTGDLVWGRLRTRDAWGQRRHSRRERATWTVRHDEALCVVPQELWDQALGRR